MLIVAEAFGGGVFEMARMKAEGVAARGHTVAIAYGVRPETPADPRSRIDPAVELIPMPWKDRSLRAQIRAQRALRSLCAAWKPDVVHLMSSFAGLHGAIACRSLPTVYTPGAYAFTITSERRAVRWAYLVLESFTASRVGVVGACSNSEGAQARALPGAHSVVVVPNGIEDLNPPLEPPEVQPVDPPRVVAVGRPLPQRQPEACARILAGVRGEADVLWIGGGSDDSAGTHALREAGIPMTGWLPREETLRTLTESAAYLHWTAWDGLPLSILEAMARDVPVVASDIGPNREVLGPRQVCRSEAEAVSLLRRLLRDPGLRDEFLANQREQRKLYSADAMVAHWLEVYVDLVEGSRLRRDWPVAAARHSGGRSALV